MSILILAVIVAATFVLLAIMTMTCRKNGDGLSMEERFERHKANMAAIDEAGQRREAARVAASEQYDAWSKELIRATEQAGLKPGPVPFTPDLDGWEESSRSVSLDYASSDSESRSLSMAESARDEDDAFNPHGHGTKAGGLDTRDPTTYF